METVNRPVLHLLEFLVCREGFQTHAHTHTHAHLVADAVEVNSMCDNLPQDILCDRVVLRLFHTSHRPDHATTGIHNHKPAILTVLVGTVLSRPSHMYRRRPVALRRCFFVTIDDDFVHGTPFRQGELLAMPPITIEIKEMIPQRLLDKDVEQLLATRWGCPHLRGFH